MLRARATKLGRNLDMPRNVPTDTFAYPSAESEKKKFGRRRTACEKKDGAYLTDTCHATFTRAYVLQQYRQYFVYEYQVAFNTSACS